MTTADIEIRQEMPPDDDQPDDYGQEVIQVPWAINPDNGIEEILPGLFWSM